MERRELEEGLKLQLDFDKLKSVAAGEAVLPVVVQHADSGEVLILAYVNREALQRSLSESRCVFYSTSRQQLWIKGESSGDRMQLVKALVNCEQNSLLFLVRPAAGVCHTRDSDGQTRGSCYYRSIEGEGPLLRWRRAE